MSSLGTVAKVLKSQEENPSVRLSRKSTKTMVLKDTTTTPRKKAMMIENHMMALMNPANTKSKVTHQMRATEDITSPLPSPKQAILARNRKKLLNKKKKLKKLVPQKNQRLKREREANRMTAKIDPSPRYLSPLKAVTYRANRL